jgi:hypothetical protein
MKLDRTFFESAMATRRRAVRVGVMVIASSIVFAMAVIAGTSIGRAIYYLSHA